jgi:ABC-type glycerol-3-phosphate transport system permease component
MCAAATIIMLPMMIFGFFVQKYFARGMVNGAVKG